jgi:quinol monooxygenase YgiN
MLPPQRLAAPEGFTLRSGNGSGESRAARDLEDGVYFIVVKFTTKPEWTDRWLDLVSEFTAASRAEPGNLWFEWNRSVEEPDTFTLVEAFADDGAEAHVSSDHFAKGLAAMRPALARTPSIVSRRVEGSGWDEMGELRIE